jgi:hypothetical protein
MSTKASLGGAIIQEETLWVNLKEMPPKGPLKGLMASAFAGAVTKSDTGRDCSDMLGNEATFSSAEKRHDPRSCDRRSLEPDFRSAGNVQIGQSG